MADGPDRLRTGAVAEIIAQRGPNWEHRLFAQALISVLKGLPSVQRPTTPARIETVLDMIDWSKSQLRALEEFIERVTAIVQSDLQAALGPPGVPGNIDSILLAVWALGQQAARMAVLAESARRMPVAERFRAVRDLVARTADQYLREMAEFGPRLLGAIDQACKASPGSPARRVDAKFKFDLANRADLRVALDRLRQLT
jgi:hypothetical protein